MEDGVILDLQLIKKIYADYSKDKKIVELLISKVQPSITYNQDLFNYIYDYYKNVKMLPPLSLIAEKFNINFSEVPDTDLSTGHLIYQVIDRYIRNMTSTYLKSVDMSIEDIRYVISPMSRIVNEYNKFFEDDSPVKIMEIEECINDSIKEMGRKGVLSPWPTLNSVFPGMRNDNILLISGRPGTGKTFVMIKWVLDLILNGNHKVLFVNSEMVASEIINRMISLMTGIKSLRLLNNNLEPEEKEQAFAAFNRLKEKGTGKLFLLENGFDSKYENINKAIEKVMPDIVFIDGVYLFRIGEESDIIKMAGMVADALKRTCTEYKIPIVATTQLNREATKEDPGLQHLALSDAFGRNASYVLYLKTNKMLEKRNISVVYLIKNRHGYLCNYAINLNNFDEISMAPEDMSYLL